MKLLFVLAVTVLLAVSTVQALNIQQEQEILKQVALLQGTMEESNNEVGDNNRVVATASNGSESSILQELHLNNRVRRGADCMPAGPYGGTGGKPFHELLDDCNAVVTALVISSGDFVDFIYFEYKLSNGETFSGRPHGGTGGHYEEIKLYEEMDEHIVEIDGSSGYLVNYIAFATSIGRILGPFGKPGSGTPFHVQNCNLRGIFGRSGSMLDSIGFYCAGDV